MLADVMLGPAHNHSDVHDAVRRLLDEAKEQVYRDLVERRSKVRYPFFRPVVLESDSPTKRSLSAFTRDISRNGVGLLHSMPLDLAEFRLRIPSEFGNQTTLRTRLVWCRPCGEGWYVSGGEFLGPVDDRAS